MLLDLHGVNRRRDVHVGGSPRSLLLERHEATAVSREPRERADGPPVDEVGAFERRLRVDATLWSEADVSTSLAQIFRKVAIDPPTHPTVRWSHPSSRRSREPRPPQSRTPTDKTPLSGPAPAPTGQPGTVLSIEDVAADVRIIRVGRPPGLQFVAGQYVKLGVPGGAETRVTAWRRRRTNLTSSSASS